MSHDFIDRKLAELDAEVSRHRLQYAQATAALFVGIGAGIAGLFGTVSSPFFFVLTIASIGGAWWGFRRRNALRPAVRHLEVQRGNTQKGRDAEDDVATRFRSLPDPFHVIHDFLIPDGRGNVDHLLFGVRGIIAIETKNISGHYQVDGNLWRKLYHNNDGSIGEYVLDRSPSEQALGAANRVEWLLGTSGIRLRVQPAVVLADPLCRVDIHGSGVPVWRLERLLESVRSLPPETDLLAIGRAVQMLYERHQRVATATWPAPAPATDCWTRKVTMDPAVP